MAVVVNDVNLDAQNLYVEKLKEVAKIIMFLKNSAISKHRHCSEVYYNKSPCYTYLKDYLLRREVIIDDYNQLAKLNNWPKIDDTCSLYVESEILSTDLDISDETTRTAVQMANEEAYLRKCTLLARLSIMKARAISNYKKCVIELGTPQIFSSECYIKFIEPYEQDKSALMRHENEKLEVIGLPILSNQDFEIAEMEICRTRDLVITEHEIASMNRIIEANIEASKTNGDKLKEGLSEMLQSSPIDLKDPVTLFFILICLIVAAMVVSSWVSAPKPIAPKKELTDAQRVTTAPSLLGSQSENNDSE
jgi:hypothetical protein